MQFAVGDNVQKVKGYRWPGKVVAVFTTIAGYERVVVECTVPEVAGALHIYAPEQLVKIVDCARPAGENAAAVIV